MANEYASGAAQGALAGTMIAPGIGTAIGAGAGLLQGFFSSRAAKKREAEIRRLLSGPAIQNLIAQLFPELSQYRNSGVGGLVALLTGQAAQGNQGAQTAFNDTLARSGLLGGGLNAGGNAALQLAGNANIQGAGQQARSWLMDQIASATQQASGIQAQKAGLIAGTPLANPFGNLMQGAGLGLSVSDGANGFWGRKNNTPAPLDTNRQVAGRDYGSSAPDPSWA